MWADNRRAHLCIFLIARNGKPSVVQRNDMRGRRFVRNVKFHPYKYWWKLQNLKKMVMLPFNCTYCFSAFLSILEANIIVFLLSWEHNVGYDCYHPLGRMHHMLIALANQNQIVLIHQKRVTGFTYFKKICHSYLPKLRIFLDLEYHVNNSTTTVR